MATDRRTSIRASQLRNFSVTGYDIKATSISGSEKLIDGSVTDAKLNKSYVLADGTRAMTGDLTLTEGSVISNALNSSVSGTETIDTFADTLGKGCVWHYVVSKSTSMRAGSVIACWNSADTVEYTESRTNDIGNTTGLTMAVDISANMVRLRATGVDGGWEVKAIRNLI